MSGVALGELPREFRPYSGAEFFARLANDIATAQTSDKVSLATMSLEPNEPAVRVILDGLANAALQGADVTLAVDAYTFLYPRGVGPIALPLPLGLEAIQRRRKALERVSHAGGQVGVINNPTHRTASLYSGRSHLKINAINDLVYLGGPSLHGTERSDMVVAFEHGETADWLHQLTGDIVKAGSTSAVLGPDDLARDIDDKTQLLVDAGKRNQSLILDEALGLIDNADEHITLGSQYFPAGVTGKHLLAAHKRGVDVYIAYNHPSKHDRLTAIHKGVLGIQRVRSFPEEFFAHQVPVELPKLHAKALASEKAAIVGSHNYVNTGVRLGTPEIALIRHDTDFATSVRSLLLRMVQLR